MPKMRITEVATLPTGCARFQDTVPELKNAFLAKVAEGKVVSLPNWSTVTSADGFTTTTTVSVWNDKADFETFKNWVLANYSTLRAEYYYEVFKNQDSKATVITTEQEE